METYSSILAGTERSRRMSDPGFLYNTVYAGLTCIGRRKQSVFSESVTQTVVEFSCVFTNDDADSLFIMGTHLRKKKMLVVTMSRTRMSLLLLLAFPRVDRKTNFVVFRTYLKHFSF